MIQCFIWLYACVTAVTVTVIQSHSDKAVMKHYSGDHSSVACLPWAITFLPTALKTKHLNYHVCKYTDHIHKRTDLGTTAELQGPNTNSPHSSESLSLKQNVNNDLSEDMMQNAWLVCLSDEMWGWVTTHWSSGKGWDPVQGQQSHCTLEGLAPVNLLLLAGSDRLCRFLSQKRAVGGANTGGFFSGATQEYLGLITPNK